VPNHAFALMVDGGTFNGRTITGVGLVKAAQIQYRALTRYLTSGATFADNAAALNQSCTDLTGTFGITSADCLQVNNAILAVEMTNPWPCATATPPPAAYCPIGTAPNPAILADGFESGFGNWTPSSTAAGIWGVTTGFARTGVRSVWGEDVNDTSDHRLTMTTPLTLPAAARMSFDHAFEFEHSVFSGVAFDGGLIEYSTDGTAWSDAGGFIDAGQAYNGTFAPGNVLGERPGFVRSSFGYTASRLNLSGLAGQRVRFRFRIGTDTSVGSLGWIMDNVRIYTCGTALPPTTVGDTYTTPFETTLQVAAPGVLLNDRENGGGTVTAQLVTNVSNGSLALNTNGSLAYTPRAGFSGTDTFSYRAVSSSSEPGNIVTVTIATAPRAPDPPSGLYAVSIVGSTVTLRWSAPVGDPAPTGYLVEGGLSPGGVIASFATRGTAPIATFEAPRGSFYVRIHALSGSTRSVASNEILIHVNVPVAPSAPANLLGMVDGSNVALAWTNTFAGGPPATVLLEVTGAANTTVPVSATESVQFAGVPDGTYTVRLRAQNPGGVSAGASNSVTLTFPGDCSGVPLAPTNVLMFNSGPTIVVIWEPPMTGAAPTSYVVDVNGAFVGSFPTTRRSLAGSAGPGSYTLSVRATNACGSGPATAPQTVTIP
jgi:hypothetical protein